LGLNGVIGVGDDETPGHLQIVPSSVTSNTVQPWQSVAPVVVGTATNLFFGVGGAPGGPLWAVGYSTGAGGIDLNMTQEFQPGTGGTPAPTTSPTRTRTPAIAPTSTATPIPACDWEF